MVAKHLIHPFTQKQYYRLMADRPEPMEGTQMEDRWLSVNEIAVYLGITTDSVYRWIESKSMPAHRVGRRWRFRKEEIDEWVKSGGADDRSASDTET